ncbi:DUF6223 family protein [Streptomyces sp. NPDC058394]|uniref:DUF6223 family protein n=1 Tax=Streptomyces sp. NPDC058394 TaxID=3346477 RepID=UPI0036557610
MAGAALLGVFVLGAPAAARVTVQPSAASVYTMSAGRLEATTAAVLGLIGAAIAGLALARPNGRFATGSGRLGANVALAAAFIWWTACSAGWRCSAHREVAADTGAFESEAHEEFTSCVGEGWDPTAEVSAHYVVRSSDGNTWAALHAGR